MPTAHELRLRFRDLTEEASAIRQSLKPLQDQVDGLNNHIAAKQAELRDLTAELLKERRPLVATENERAAISRQLGRKTGLE